MAGLLGRLFRRRGRELRCAAVVPAAGSSTRMGQDKLLLPLVDQPVLLHTLRPLELCPYITEIVVVDYGYYIQNTYRVEDFAALRDALSLSAQEQLCVSGAEDPVSVVSADGVRRIIQW